MTRRTIWNLAALFAVMAVVAVAGCTGGDDNADEKPKPTTTTSLPEECDGADVAAPAEEDAASATTSTLPQDCADAVFTSLIEEDGSEELRALDAEQQLGFGHGMCAYAAALKANPDDAPSYDELVTSTSESWGTSTEVVEEVLGLAANLCPGQLDPILDLRTNPTKITVEMSGTGSGELAVTYTTPDGGNLQDSVQSPWEQQVILDEAVEVRVAVSGKGEVTCSFSINGERLAEETVTDDEAVCTATAAQVRDAAR
jgi:hypothetical protein